MQRTSVTPSQAELPRPILLAFGGLVAITFVVFAAVGLRGLLSGGSGDRESRPVAAAKPSAGPQGGAPAPSSAEPAAADAPPESRRELRALMEKDLQTGRFTDFVTHLEKLLEVDPEAAKDKQIRSALVEVLMRIMVGGGETPERIFKILESKMGTTGIDVLYELVTTRGSSRAAERAAELLKDEDVRERGSPAFRIAYDMRMASCDEKAKLFERAKTDGDSRTLGQLQLMNRRCSRRGRDCCMHNDPGLRDAMDGIKSRLGL